MIVLYVVNRSYGRTTVKKRGGRDLGNAALVRTFFIRVHRACGFVEHRERRFPEIVKINVSLVWAISLRNVVIGKYGPEKHPRQTHALLFAPAQHIRPVVFRHVKAEGLRLHEFREVHGAQRLNVKK